MTTQADIVNLALQAFGSRTTVTAAELLANSTNEAKQVNIAYDNTRNSLLRMAPWNCALATDALDLRASNTEGDPWEDGLPRPPWIYEYDYPSDCLKACWIAPGPVTFKIGVVGDDERVILTNQADAVLTYVRDITDPDAWDPLLQDAMASALGARICIALTGDKVLANMCIRLANVSISEARRADGHEGLTAIDLTPDWIRGRGYSTVTYDAAPPYGYEWGSLLPLY